MYRGFYQGSEVAVKRLNVPLSSQDKNYFTAEVSLNLTTLKANTARAHRYDRLLLQVNLLRELRHPRVVLLVGICTTARLPIMLLELMVNGNLFDYLHEPSK